MKLAITTDLLGIISCGTATAQSYESSYASDILLSPQWRTDVRSCALSYDDTFPRASILKLLGTEVENKSMGTRYKLFSMNMLVIIYVESFVIFDFVCS